MNMLLTGILLLGGLAGFAYWKIGSLTRQLQKQQQALNQIKAEAATLNKELKNAKLAKKIAKKHRTLSDDDIDRQLREQGTLRSD
ncbi:DUF2681 domain-containing protein [Volucribacter amazonae]|uniref:Uncharacterized protein n=1 Tax=Volucribacter amazonae TaxID=256731 RepID=A0A9X4PD47_9PAST|nr:DUF2681 domain-containing protein [Volucribacter amazonae]MDG6895054.1 hypothetical protein [Volucribacter amazonae]